MFTCGFKVFFSYFELHNILVGCWFYSLHDDPNNGRFTCTALEQRAATKKNSMNHSPSINNKIHRLLIDTARTIMRTINLRFADVSVRLNASLALIHKQTAQMQQQQKITKASGLEYGESTRYRQCEKTG